MTIENTNERWKRWRQREGVVVVSDAPMLQASQALLRSVPTRHHAEGVVAAVLAALGERAVLDDSRPSGDPAVHLRDEEMPTWIVPVPLVELGVPQTVMIMIKGDPPPPVPMPDIVPTGPAMRAGALTIREGGAHFTIDYDERGIASGSGQSASDPTFVLFGATEPYAIDQRARPPTPPPIGLLRSQDGTATAAVAGRIGARIAELAEAHARAIPARAIVPARIPLFVTGVLQQGVAFMRKALFQRDVPRDARFAVVDALDGSAIAFGATRHEAIARWTDELFRKKPRPPSDIAAPPPEAPPPELPRVLKDEHGKIVGASTGTLKLSFGGRGPVIPWPAAVPANIPGVLVPIPPLPPDPDARTRAAGFTRWARVVGQHGAIRHALFREEARGFTLIGEGVVDLVSVETLEADLDAADQAEAEVYPDGVVNPWTDPTHPMSLVTYRCFDDFDRKAMRCVVANGAFGDAFSPVSLNGDELEWRVARARTRARG